MLWPCDLASTINAYHLNRHPKSLKHWPGLVDWMHLFLSVRAGGLLVVPGSW